MRYLLPLALLVFYFSHSTAQHCRNNHVHCTFWAQRGECEKNPRWMRTNCRVACGTCFRSIPPIIRRQPQSFATSMPQPGPLPLAATLAPPVLSNTSITESPFNRAFSITPRPSSIPEGCNSVMTVQVENRQIFAIDQVRLRQRQQLCADQQTSTDCSINLCYHKKYRSMDGTCNNFARTTAGAAFTAYSRLLNAGYDDGINTLVSAATRRRPNARELSMFLLSSMRSLPSHANSLLMQFGQFVSHDITALSAQALCTCAGGSPLCSNVASPPSDRGHSCLAFTRSFPICGTGQFGRVREQLNENTAFLDGSLIYGSEAISGRTLRVGAMLRSSIINGKVYPPIMRNNMHTGDSRATLFVGLAAMHTSFLRLHNNVAARLQNMNRHWNPDRIYQESRKIVGAVIQVITYQEYVPKLIGPFFQKLVEPYESYKPEVNPAIINEFAGAAYRLHGMIQEEYPLIGANFQQIGRFSFVDGVNNFNSILSTVDFVFRGLIATPARNPQRITTSVTERLFGGQADMATTNVQRGRDHGLRSYNDYRKLCQLPALTDFNNWSEVSDVSVRQRVAQLYQTPNDVDLYVGGILEDPVEGSMVGPTFACIIAEQFVRLRDGDRFYYENPGVFTSAQLASLRRVSMSWLLCETGDNMSRIVRQAFEIDQGQRSVPCQSIPSLDLNPWAE